jgi:hypothetical protein
MSRQRNPVDPKNAWTIDVQTEATQRIVFFGQPGRFLPFRLPPMLYCGASRFVERGMGCQPTHQGMAPATGILLRVGSIFLAVITAGTEVAEPFSVLDL